MVLVAGAKRRAGTSGRRSGAALALPTAAEKHFGSTFRINDRVRLAQQHDPVEAGVGGVRFGFAYVVDISDFHFVSATRDHYIAVLP
jgi:hypothetical protein